jgi:hypothetical protein
MDRLPFTVYDVFACVVSGLVAIVAADSAFGSQQAFQADLTFTRGAFLIIVSYIWGHILAQVSGYLFEKLLVRGVLRSPEETLLHKHSKTLRSRLFPGFYEPLPPHTRARVLEKAVQYLV